MRSQLPYLSSLATKYAYATNYTAITHPSLPNYLALAGGSTFGVKDDSPPASHKIPARSMQPVGVLRQLAGAMPQQLLTAGLRRPRPARQSAGRRYPRLRRGLRSVTSARSRANASAPDHLSLWTEGLLHPQTRPCDARDLRAKESTATASARTTPVIMKRKEDDKLSRVNPLEIAEMTKIPSNAE